MMEPAAEVAAESDAAASVGTPTALRSSGPEALLLPKNEGDFEAPCQDEEMAAMEVSDAAPSGGSQAPQDPRAIAKRLLATFTTLSLQAGGPDKYLQNKFKTPELATQFKEGVEAAKVEMGKVLAGEDAADTTAGDEAAAALGGATIFKVAGADAADSDSDEEAQ